LSDFALSLETAAKHENLSFIKERNEDFIAELEALLEKIGNALSHKGEQESSNRDELKEFRAKLSVLMTALDDMDAGSINQTLSDLQATAATKRESEAVRNISAKVLISDYDEAILMIKDLLSS
jgi:soluble cytochrome b562